MNIYLKKLNFLKKCYDTRSVQWITFDHMFLRPEFNFLFSCLMNFFLFDQIHFIQYFLEKTTKGRLQQLKFLQFPDDQAIVYQTIVDQTIVLKQ